MSGKELTRVKVMERLKARRMMQAEVGRVLGITTGLLAKWRDELRQKPKQEEAFPGNGRQLPSEARVRELERGNSRLRMEKEILKKVLGMYSKDQGLKYGLVTRVQQIYPVEVVCAPWGSAGADITPGRSANAICPYSHEPYIFPWLSPTRSSFVINLWTGVFD